jgi:hypothetical protein
MDDVGVPMGVIGWQLSGQEIFWLGSPCYPWKYGESNPSGLKGCSTLGAQTADFSTGPMF